MNQIVHWSIPTDHPAFAGHFPGAPIFPGVLLLEETLRAIATTSGIALDICEISVVKFLSPTGPGDEVVIRHVLSERGTLTFDILVGTRKIATGQIVPKSLL